MKMNYRHNNTLNLMSFIKNRESILRHHKFQSVKDSLDALDYAFKNCSPEKLVNMSIEVDSTMRIIDINRNIHEFSLPNDKSILVISVGKASEKMLAGLVKKIGDRIARSILIVPKGYEMESERILSLHNSTVIYSSHPIPNSKSLLASKVVIRELEHLDNIDIVIFLISGGSSSLIVSPIAGITLSDKKEINKRLITCGANIDEINIVRKHLSEIKGGKILRFLNPKRKVISIILSDVVGDNLSTIGSGLTFYDNSTYKDAISVLQNYSIFKEDSELIRRVRKVLTRGIGIRSLETVKPIEFNSLAVNNCIIGNNSKFCKKIIFYLRSAGYNVQYKGSHLTMSMKDFISLAKDTFNKLGNEKTAILFGGEITNVIDKSQKGIGGRNQEAICRMIEFINTSENSDFCVICIGTDGIDGNSKDAGGLMTPATSDYSETRGLQVKSFLKSQDSNTLLRNLHSTINTGYTGTNFNDIYLFVRTK